jgi:hypothetical protein
MEYLKSPPHMFINSPVLWAADLFPSGPSVEDRQKFSLPQTPNGYTKIEATVHELGTILPFYIHASPFSALDDHPFNQPDEMKSSLYRARWDAGDG